MEKRVQVFVSSTFVDLAVERQAVVQTLLKLNSFPAGMELFPASDEDKWELIKGVIDDSDYYCLIIGARYGSEDDGTQLSYTEMEYDYAQETSKPTMVFMHRNPDLIPQGKTDKNPEKAAKLEAFKAKVGKSRNAQFFENAHELAAGVAVSMTDILRRRPAIGWVRGDAAMTPEIRGELIELRAAAATKSVLGTVPVFPDLEDGDDDYEFDVKFEYNSTDSKYYGATLTCFATWNEIFAGIAPALLHETSEGRFRNQVDSVLCTMAEKIALEDDDVEKVHNLEIESEDSFGDILIQLMALRLVERGTIKRAVNDPQKYWKLTQNGEDRMMQLRARRKKPAGAIDVAASID